MFINVNAIIKVQCEINTHMYVCVFWYVGKLKGEGCVTFHTPANDADNSRSNRRGHRAGFRAQ